MEFIDILGIFSFNTRRVWWLQNQQPKTGLIRQPLCHRKIPPTNWIASLPRLALPGKRGRRVTVAGRWKCIPGYAAAAPVNSMRKICRSWRFTIVTTIMTIIRVMAATGSCYASIVMITSIPGILTQVTVMPREKCNTEKPPIIRLRTWRQCLAKRSSWRLPSGNVGTSQAEHKGTPWTSPGLTDTFNQRQSLMKALSLLNTSHESCFNFMKLWCGLP